MFWQVIAANRRRTVLLVLAMAVILVCLGFFLGEAIAVLVGFVSPPDAGFWSPWRPGLIGAGFALGLWAFLLALSVAGGDQLFLGLAGAREVSREMHPVLFNVVEEMVIASSLGVMPRIYIVEDTAPNAFAVGRGPKRSSICLTAGLLALCDRDELQGVVAHEIGHIINRDALFLTVAATMLGTVTMIGDAALRSLRFAPAARYRSVGARPSRGAANLWILLAALVFIVLSPLMIRILYFMVSRNREYLADATSARLTRYPEGLASALEKIASWPQGVTTAPRAASPLYIVNPFVQEFEGSLFDTHPPIGRRIRILRSMQAGAAFSDYMKAYWNVIGARKPLIPLGEMELGRPVEKRGPSRDANQDPAAGGAPRRLAAGDIIRAVNGYLFIPCACGMTMKVPPEFTRGGIRCPRCGREHAVGNPDVAHVTAVLGASSPAGASSGRRAGEGFRVQVEKRRPGTWQVVTCGVCKGKIELSSAFRLDSITCKTCGNRIRFRDAS